MCDEGSPWVSRRTFGLGAAAVAGASGLPVMAQPSVVETPVNVKTPDGVADAVLFHPATGKHPAVLIWPDAYGLRPAIIEMARRLAGQGYVVLAPNPFYRSGRAPVFPQPLDFDKPEDRARMTVVRALLTGPAVEGDARAYLDFLDAQPQTDRRRKAGVQGYCMGGAMAFRTAAIRPERIGAVGSFHGGGLVTQDASSPHLLLPRTRASFLVAVARNDDQKEPDAKVALKAAFVAAGRPAVVEVYPADHGWCVSDNRRYDPAAAEKAWSELTALYAKALR